MSAAVPGRDVRVYLGEGSRRYAFGSGHPFDAARVDAFVEEMRWRGLDRRVEIREPAPAPRDVIERFHDPAYVDRLQRLSWEGVGVLDAGDTPVFPGIYEAAATVVGATVAACEALLAGECRRAFVPVGGLHHARRDGAAGFCALNDCGVAIETLERAHHLSRIAYVDIDVHHGDGVYYAFADDPRVAIADVHEDGRFLYPGTGDADERGRGEGLGTKLNLPLPPGSGDREFAEAWRQVEAFVDAARPQIVLLQCGADGLAGDPLADLRYTPEVHRRVARDLARIAERHCDGRLLALGGGGYDHRNVARAWCEVLGALVED